MTTNDHVNACGFSRNPLVHRIARVGQNDDLVHALSGQFINLALNRIHGIGKDHVRTGACEFIRVMRCQTDKTDLFAATFDHCRLQQFVRQQRLARKIGVRHQHGEFNAIHKSAQNFGAVVEFVVTNGHTVVAQEVHELRRHRALIEGVEQRALELVAAINEDRVVRPCASLGHRCDQTRSAAETFTRGVVLCRTGRIVFADRFKASVEIVRVQNGQRIIRHCSAGRQRKSTRRC